ncbi:hypothetical protein [Streptomyces adelaidensis]|uniref:hypothetical protein n=1 Tax=Streptomyces adelaidensis TaxID=2796465 RepID=UPI001905C87F|nr:hypothetical protein [Streptomyces adelaidensis]
MWHDRYAHHGRVARTPDSTLDPESLAALAADCPGRVVAIEAVRTAHGPRLVRGAACPDD